MKIICGIDEAGRGPLAGPVTAAAVILPAGFPFEILNDSKKMTPPQRERAALIIRKSAVSCSAGWCWPEEIDRINIHNASLLAMKRAFSGISEVPDIVLVDGKFVPSISAPCRAVIKGDTKIREIQAASIIAKTLRDLWMIRYSWIETDYNFEKHKGYPTKEHRYLCSIYGLSPIHRRSFRYS